MNGNRPLDRYLLWVDAVGGFLVCLDDNVVIGQASTGNDVGIAIMADLSRRHAAVRREDDNYILVPLAKVAISGVPMDRPTLLNDGDEIELQDCVRLRFRQPHPLSATARLDFLSHHRPQPSVDSVLLMSDSCVLGPSLSNHVVCRRWSCDVVLYRSKGALACRSLASLEVDGRPAKGSSQLRRNSRVTGDDFALSLEQI